MNMHAPQAQDTSYRGWLALVIILGAMIVLMIGALIAGLFLNAGQNASAAPYLTTLPVQSQQVQSVALDGDRILVRLSGIVSGDELVVIDAGSGRILGRITVSPQP
jgi:hypothetical protein